MPLMRQNLQGYAKNDEEYLKKRANFSAKISAILGIFIGILVIIFAQDILLLLVMISESMKFWL